VGVDLKAGGFQLSLGVPGQIHPQPILPSVRQPSPGTAGSGPAPMAPSRCPIHRTVPALLHLIMFQGRDSSFLKQRERSSAAPF
jgi:hypothetical protein